MKITIIYVIIVFANHTTMAHTWSIVSYVPPTKFVFQDFQRKTGVELCNCIVGAGWD